MIRRSRQVVTAASVSALALGGVISGGFGVVNAAQEGGGWTVDTSSCPDEDVVNAPIEGQVVIGSAMPLSGGVAAAAFEPAARGFKAYVQYANEQGLLPDVEIVAEIGDDQYNPSLTPGVVQGLVDDGAHVISALIGTGGADAVQDSLNEECVPMLNLLTGDPRWGDEVGDYPWTTGLLTSYRLESQGYAASIVEQFPDASVGLFYVDNEFGNVYMDAFREAADEEGLSLGAEETVEQGDEAPPEAQLAALASEAPDVIMATPLGIQCVTFLNALGEAKKVNPDWDPKVYITNTCASPLILGAAGANAEGIYSSASMGLRDVTNPEEAAKEPVAGYLAEMERQGLADIVTTGGAGWNAAEVTVQVLIDAANSPDGLTRASIINAARNLNFHPTLLRDGMNYVMNGQDDAFYSESIQVIQYSAGGVTNTEIGEAYNYESSPDAGEPTVAAPIGGGETPTGSDAPNGS